MADSDSSIWFTVFQQKEHERKTENSPHMTGSLEIDPESLINFIKLVSSIEPEESWKDDGTKMIKLRCASWNNETKNGKPYFRFVANPSQQTNFKKDQPFINGDKSSNTQEPEPVVCGIVTPSSVNPDDEEI